MQSSRLSHGRDVSLSVTGRREKESGRLCVLAWLARGRWEERATGHLWKPECEWQLGAQRALPITCGGVCEHIATFAPCLCVAALHNACGGEPSAHHSTARACSSRGPPAGPRFLAHVRTCVEKDTHLPLNTARGPLSGPQEPPGQERTCRRHVVARLTGRHVLISRGTKAYLEVAAVGETGSGV